MTWQELTTVEPELLALETDLKSIRDEGGAAFCANSIWYFPQHGQRSFKYRLCELVGWQAPEARLRNSEAYDVAYHHLYRQLPGCRNCNCA